jgi:hypothetical protein
MKTNIRTHESNGNRLKSHAAESLRYEPRRARPIPNQLFLKHFEEQVELMDTIAERIQILRGLTRAMATNGGEQTNIPLPPPRPRRGAVYHTFI